MYIQLGNFIFDQSFSPESINHTDESSFAEHALIGIKPRLQPTGNNLEEFDFSIKLRAEIVNITETLLALKKAKDTAEILPFLYGYGAYMGDFVITKIDRSIIYTLDDGTPVEVSVSISIKEYAVADKLQQQQNAARKAAFAVGDKQPVALPPIPKYSPVQIASKDLSSTYSHAAITDNNIRSYENNVSQRQNLADKIQTSLTSMDKSLDKVQDKISSLSVLTTVASIAANIATVKNAIANFSFPVLSISQLTANNTNLQAAIRSLKSGSFEITNLTITRNG